MKKQSQPIPTVSKYTILRQLSNLIPPHLVPKLARETGVAQQERTFSSWSQTVALMFAHLTHAIGLNDVCDALRMNRGPLAALGDAGTSASVDAGLCRRRKATGISASVSADDSGRG